MTVVSGDVHARARVAADLLAVAGRDDVVVAAGPDAIDVLLADAARPDPAVVAAIGPHTNLAAALRRDPGYATRVPRLVVMGGSFGPIEVFGVRLPPGRDTNLVADPAASLASLAAGFVTRYVPIDVTFRTTLRTRHLERLRGGDALGRALAGLCDRWRAVLHTRAEAPVPDDVVAFLHDPLTVACVVTRELVTTEIRPVRVVLEDGVPRTVVDPQAGRPAEVVTDVDTDAFVEHWCAVVTGG